MTSNTQRDEDQDLHEHGKAYVKARLKTGTLNWAKETATGIVSSAAIVLLCLILVNLGLAQEGQELNFALFQPYEFWKSFSGLVIEWSQWNEWLLLGLGLAVLALTLLVYVRWRRGVRADEIES